MIYYIVYIILLILGYQPLIILNTKPIISLSGRPMEVNFEQLSHHSRSRCIILLGILELASTAPDNPFH